MLCLFPMEPQLYIDAGGKAEFVGHPMAQTMPVEADRAAARQKLGVHADVPVFAILPGSRAERIRFTWRRCFFQTGRIAAETLSAGTVFAACSDGRNAQTHYRNFGAA